MVGSIRVEPMQHCLVRNGVRIRVEPRVMKVLLVLAEHPKRVVSRDELLTSAWPQGYTSDEALTKAISQLRKALGDTIRTDRIIETIPKTGYRLIGSVVPAQVPYSGNAIHDRAPLATTSLANRLSSPHSTQPLWMTIAVLCVLLIGQGVYFLRSSAPETTPHKKYIVMKHDDEPARLSDSSIRPKPQTETEAHHARPMTLKVNGIICKDIAIPSRQAFRAAIEAGTIPEGCTQTPNG